jgi:hypothetical protein
MSSRSIRSRGGASNNVKWKVNGGGKPKVTPGSKSNHVAK